MTPSGTKIALGIDDLAEYAKLESDEIKPLLVRLSAGENRILTPVAPPPDRPARESYQIFHDVLAGAVLEWRNQYERTAERAASDARAEEQRLRAEHEASISARLRKQRRMLGAALIAASTLLVVVGVLGYFIFTTAGELSQLQTAFSRSDERVRQLLADAAAAQKAVVGYYEEAQRLAQEAVARAAAGDATGAKDLNTRAANASKQAETANAKVAQINSAIQKEQINSAEIRAKADALGEKLPGSSPADGWPARHRRKSRRLPTRRTPPPRQKTRRQPARPASSLLRKSRPSAHQQHLPREGAAPSKQRRSTTGIVTPTNERSTPKNRRRWAEARKLFEEALSQNSVESTERIPAYQGSETMNPTSPATISDWRSAISATAKVRWRTGSSLKPTER